MSKILIVEDEQDISMMLQEYLADLGYETESVSDGQQAVENVRSSPPDLIIMDLMLPRLTGGEAAHMLRSEPETSAIPILAISGVSDAEELADILAVDAVLIKPFDLNALKAQIDLLLQSEVS